MLAKIKQTGTQLVVGAMTLFLGAQSALAQGAAVIPGSETPVEAIPVLSGTSLTQLIEQIINVLLVVVGILAVIYLIYGGIMYITAGGDAEKANKGRVAITNAIIGIVIIMLALAIYNFVIQGVRSGDVTG